MYSLSGVCTRWLKEGPLEAEFSDALAFFTSDAFCVCLRHYLISPFLLLHRGFICSIRHWDFLRLGDSLFWQLWRKKMKVSEPPGTFHWPMLLLSFVLGPGRDLCGTTALVPELLCKVGLNPGTGRSLCHLGLCCLSKVLEAVLPLTVKAGDCCTLWWGARLEKCLIARGSKWREWRGGREAMAILSSVRAVDFEWIFVL